MKMLRLVSSVLLLVALGIAVTRTTSSAAPTAGQAHCTQVALGAAFAGQSTLDSIQKFGCVNDWAYTWATIGTGQTEIGVTEVLQFQPVAQRWILVSRLDDCQPSILPPLVYRQGCFSN